MTSAIAAMEHRSRGQIGQPAACMIENNPVLSAAHVFWTRDYGLLGLVSKAHETLAGIETTVRSAQSTACVDNFVGNLLA